MGFDRGKWTQYVVVVVDRRQRKVTGDGTQGRGNGEKGEDRKRRQDAWGLWCQAGVMSIAD